MGIFVSIDGVDGVGKTTVAKQLADKCGYKYYKSPAGPFAEMRDEVDKYASPVGRYCFYRLALQYDSQNIAKLLNTGSVVVDRYSASTIAYHTVLDARVWNIHQEDGLLKPTYSILLSARTAVRMQRLEERRLSSQVSTSDVKLEDNNVVMDRVAETFKSLNLIEIDTSDLTPEQVIDRIRHVIDGG